MNTKSAQSAETGANTFSQIVLAFYTPTAKESGNWMRGLANRFTANYTKIPGETQAFSHVELVFTEKRFALADYSDSPLLPSAGEEEEEEYNEEPTKDRKRLTFVVQWPYVPWSYALYYAVAKPCSFVIEKISKCLGRGTRYIVANDWGEDEDIYVVEIENEKTDAGTTGEDEELSHALGNIAENMDPTSKTNELEIPSSNSSVRLETGKKYGKKQGYGFIGLTVADRIYEEMLKEAANYAKNEREFRFNYAGQIFNFLPSPLYAFFSLFFSLPVEGGENGGFCSEVICKMLQKHLGILGDVVPPLVTPNGLFYHLMEETRNANLDDPTSVKPYVVSLL